MRVAVLIVGRNRPDLEKKQNKQFDALEKQEHEHEVDRIFIECSEKDFKGKCYGHNRGLDDLKKHGRFEDYDYFLFMHNDVFFPNREYGDPIDVMITTMENHKQIGVLSPTEHGSSYPDAQPRPFPESYWRKVSTCDYLCIMMRRSTLENVGFLNPDFKYCWGAIHELSYKLYKRGLCVAYEDKVQMRHLGGSTYGKKTGTISRDEYQKRAKRFAANYFKKTYGDRWDEEFTKHLPKDIKINTYKEHKKLWES